MRKMRSMRHAASRCFSFCLTLFSLAPVTVSAMPAITCHCFTDRSYDPAHPGAADPYFLATTQNTFFAALFNVDKKTVVMKKQAGTSAEDMWIAYWIASMTGYKAEDLLQAKQSHETWSAVISSRRIAPKALGNRFQAALRAHTSSLGLANTVVDELLLRYGLSSDGELASLRKAGASNQELLTSLLVAAKTGRPAGQVHAGVKSRAGSWGSALQQAGISARNMQETISSLLKKHRG